MRAHATAHTWRSEVSFAKVVSTPCGSRDRTQAMAWQHLLSGLTRPCLVFFFSFVVGFCFVLLCFVYEIKSHCVAQTGSDLIIYPTCPLTCNPPALASHVLGLQAYIILV